MTNSADICDCFNKNKVRRACDNGDYSDWVTTLHPFVRFERVVEAFYQKQTRVKIPGTGEGEFTDPRMEKLICASSKEIKRKRLLHRVRKQSQFWQRGVYKNNLHIFTYMNADVSKEKSGDIPLYALCFFGFLFLIIYNMWLAVSGKLPLGDGSSEAGSAEKRKVRGLLLEAAAKVSSLASTSLLLIETAKENFFQLFPWLVFVFKGVLVIHSLNLLDLVQFFEEPGTGETGWKSYLLYFVVIALDTAECFCLGKILEMFYELWIAPKKEAREEEEWKKSEEEEEEEEEASKVAES